MIVFWSTAPFFICWYALVHESWHSCMLHEHCFRRKAILGMRAHVQAEDQRYHREAVAAAGGAVRSSRGRCHHALGLLVVPARVPLARSCTPPTKCMPYSAEACVHAGTKRPSPSCGCAAHGNNVRFWSQRCPRFVRLIEGAGASFCPPILNAR